MQTYKKFLCLFFSKHFLFSKFQLNHKKHKLCIKLKNIAILTKMPVFAIIGSKVFDKKINF